MSDTTENHAANERRERGERYTWNVDDVVITAPTEVAEPEPVKPA